MIKRNLFYLAVISATICGIAINDAMSQVSNGRVTTASPSYTNNTTAPLSLNEDGELRITGNITATTEAEASSTAPTYSSGPNPLSQTLDGELRVINTPVGIQDVDVTATVGLTDAQLRASPVPVSGTVTANGPLTDAQLRASPVPVSGTVAVSAISSALPAGTNNIGDVDIASVPSTTSYAQAATSGTATSCTLVKASPGFLTTYSTWAGGATSAKATFSIRDNAAGTDTGTILFVVDIPIFGTNSYGQSLSFLNPIAASTGITMCYTGSAAGVFGYHTATAF